MEGECSGYITVHCEKDVRPYGEVTDSGIHHLIKKLTTVKCPFLHTLQQERSQIPSHMTIEIVNKLTQTRCIALSTIVGPPEQLRASHWLTRYCIEK